MNQSFRHTSDLFHFASVLVIGVDSWGGGGRGGVRIPPIVLLGGDQRISVPSIFRLRNSSIVRKQACFLKKFLLFKPELDAVGFSRPKPDERIKSLNSARNNVMCKYRPVGYFMLLHKSERK